jgi:uncharacterized membrane protein YbhN (UPF0104 family)
MVDTRNGQDGEGFPAPAKKPSYLKYAFMTVLTLAIVVGVFVYVLPRFASYKDVFRTLGDLDAWQVILLIAVTLANLACAWTINQASLPGLRNRQAAQLMLSQNLMSSTLPLGGAWSIGMGYGIIHSYGFGMADYTLMLGVSGLWNTFAKLVLPVAAVLMLLVSGNETGAILPWTLAGLGILLAVLVLLGLVLWKRSLALRIGQAAGRAASWFLRLFHKGPVTTWGESLAELRDQAISVARNRWPFLSGMALLNQLMTFSVFLLCLRFSGVPASGDGSVSWVVAFGVFAFVRLISAIPITPGAVGIAEASFTSLLVAAGGLEVPVVAGTLLFRGLTWLMPLLLGLPAYVAWMVKERKRMKAGEGEDTDMQPQSDKDN